MAKARGDGLQIQTALWKGKGKTILCLHGLTANCRCWDHLASSLTPRHQIIAVDLRGRGLSDKPSTGYALNHHVADMVALLDDLRLECPVIAGHSLGAFIALALAAIYPQRVERLILLDGGGKLSEAQRAKVFNGIKPSLDRLGKVFPDWESYLSSLKQIPFFQPWNPDLNTYARYEVEEVAGGISPRIKGEHIMEELYNIRTIDPSQFYPKLSSPVLILRATQGMVTEDDLVLPDEILEPMVRTIPNVRCLDLAGTNHYSILFQPNPIRDRAILEFLES
ncbi:MAG: alpha/beta hydrolase [Deltaproteobacteria bacterium]|nr:alpha/beta hydrolase [Deltaproteobacteria bacterium]